MRLDVRKTYKLFIGGQFVRGESGRHLEVQSPRGQALDNICLASRKDLRDAVAAARKAFPGWAAKTAYLRGQILYRAAEMLESRGAELAGEVARSTGVGTAAARREVALSVDRLVYAAGWSDKYSQVFSSVNPVASPHFNFTMPEPVGVVAVLAPDSPSLVAPVTVLAAVLVSGNAAVLVASDSHPLPALALGEVLATSDLPGGVVNILSGRRKDLLSHIAGHMDIDAVVDATGQRDTEAKLRAGTGINLKRYANHALPPAAWFSAQAENPYWITDTTEFKTAWHPVGL